MKVETRALPRQVSPLPPPAPLSTITSHAQDTDQEEKKILQHKQIRICRGGEFRLDSLRHP